MGIGVILTRWIEILSELLLGWNEQWRARRSLTISYDEQGFAVYQSAGHSRPALGTLAAGTPAPREIAEAAQTALVTLELPPDKIVVRRISVPARAREFLPGIVRNQIERLSPWPVEQTVYGIRAEASRADPANLDVSVSISLRAVVDDVRNELAAMGLPVHRIVVREPGAQAEPVTLWSRLENPLQESIQHTRRLIGAGIVALVVVSAGVSGWAFASAAALRGESDELVARTRTLERQLREPQTLQTMSLLSLPERAWASKELNPAAVVMLEVLSRALPDSAYLTELHLQNASLRIAGLAADAPSLIAPLERTGQLTNVHFFAPTTQSPDGTHFRFYIEAHVEPRLDLTAAGQP